MKPGKFVEPDEHPGRSLKMLGKVWNQTLQELVLGPVHKRRSQSEGRGLSSADILWTREKRGSSDANVRTFWYKIFRIFRNFWCVRTDKGEGLWAIADIFRTRGGRVNFTQFCADVFYGQPLTAVFDNLKNDITLSV